jgi:hypothetical protein
MEIEINASEYQSPGQLAQAIRKEVSQLYVDRVIVNIGKASFKVTPSTEELICKGLLMAEEMCLLRITPQDIADTMPPRVGWDQHD